MNRLVMHSRKAIAGRAPDFAVADQVERALHTLLEQTIALGDPVDWSKLKFRFEPNGAFDTRYATFTIEVEQS